MGLNIDLKVIRVGLLITLFTLIFGTGLELYLEQKRKYLKIIFLKIFKRTLLFMTTKVKIKFGDMFKERTSIQVVLLHIL